MFCNNCGKQIPDNSEFCPECGATQRAAVNQYNQPPVVTKTKKPIYKKWWVWAIAAVLVIGIIGNLGKDGKDSTLESPIPSIEATPSPSPSISPEEQKAAAIELDAKIYDIVLRSEKVTSLLQEGIGLYSDGQGTLLELYDLAKEAKDAQTSIFGELMGLGDKESSDYVEAAQFYVSNSISVAEDLQKYIDKQEIKYLSSAKESLENTQKHTLNVVSERMKYLSAQGLSDEEIANILDAQEETE
ncbi:MAG: zinc-ribbon domain-containing protein [Clostridiales bacterium]|nr:zinc-ribbon domain-containing protein [Clostridiales bacterium]